MYCTERGIHSVGLTEVIAIRTAILNKTDKLRELILKHPDWPIMVMAGEDANCGDYSLVCCSIVSAYAGEVLATYDHLGRHDHIYTDRDDYREDVSEYYLLDNWNEETGRSDEPSDVSDDEYDKILDDVCAKVDDKWRNCIIVEVDN